MVVSDDVAAISVKKISAKKAGEQVPATGWTDTDLPCPHTPGSAEAKQWWDNVMVPHVKAGVTPEMKAKYGDKVVGAWAGRPLVPGVQGSDQGDMSYLIAKIKTTQGLTSDAAYRIAAKARDAAFGQLKG